MDIAILTIKPAEKGTCFVSATFKDQLGADVVPNNPTWSLTDKDGNYINNHEDVAWADPAATMTLVLSGDDLALIADQTLERVFTVKATYDTPGYTDLPIHGEAWFTIQRLVDIT